MKQHNLLTRPPHMRSAHTNNIQIHPAPVMPQPPPQLPQKLPQTSNTIQPQPSSMRDHQNRVNKSQISTTQRNQTTQMQKIRQQHQHLSYKNNNNHHNSNSSSNNNNNNNYKQYNNINVPQQQDQQPHMGVLQQQQQQQQQPQHQITHRNVPNYQQKQHQPQQYNVLQMKNALPQQHQQQLQQTNTAIVSNQQSQQPQQFQQYSFVGNKAKYTTNTNNNNNNNTLNQTTTNYSTPKSILQNPNRLVTKSTSQSTTTAVATLVSTASKETAETEIATTARNAGESNNSSINNENCIPTQNQTQTGDHLKVQVQENTLNINDTVSSNEANKENISCDAQVIGSSGSDSSNQLHNSLLSNVDVAVTKHTKEKTPMCLVNELARFNKITHQYRLTGEKGPAHCKRFTVTLKLGDEEYTAEGFKIKKAQHLAAAQAIEKTAYKHPIPKANRNSEDGKQRPYIMPTVELNALAMKLGQQTYYLLDPRQMPPSMPPATGSEIMDVMHDGSGIPTHHYGPRPPMLPPTAAHAGGHIIPPPQPHPRMMHDPTYGPRRHYDVHGGIYPPPPPPPPLPHIQHPSQRSYLPHRGYPPINRYHQRYPLLPPPPPPGMPPAPHHMHPHFSVPTTPYKITLIVGKQKFIGVGRTLQQAKHDAAARALQVLKTKSEEKYEDDLDESVEENDAKSPISQVHEAAIKRGMQVHFKILREEGPAHMRNFITACIVGSIVTEGEGHGKKISKKRAAEKMLIELKKLPPVTPVKSPSKRIKVKTPAKISATPNSKMNAAPGSVGRRGKRDSTTVKNKDKEKVEDDDENPITKLIQIQQNRKEKEPVFEYLAKSGNDRLRRREFIVEVTAQGIAARGTGKNKKLAKRNAAENLLNALAEAAENKLGGNTSYDTTDNALDIGTVLQNESKTPLKATENVQRIPITPPNDKNYSTMNIVNVAEIPKVSTTAGQIPGVLILRQNKRSASKKKDVTATVTTVKPFENETIHKDISVSENTLKSSDTPQSSVKEAEVTVSAPAVIQNPVVTVASNSLVTSTTASNTTTTATVTAATDTTTSSKSNSNFGNSNSSTSSSSSSAPPMMKHQLLYLANLLGFQVDFSDFPKGNHNELLTIVTLSTDPPQICHGFGTSTNESQNDAARNALKILSDLGLNNAKSN